MLRNFARKWISMVVVLFASLSLVVAGCGDDDTGGGTSSSGGSDGGPDGTSSSGGNDGSVDTGASSSGDTGADTGVQPIEYSIGGNVTGLGGTTGLVLQLNGGNSLPVAVDGPFTFAAKLTNTATYSVTVSTQPTGRMCTVSAGSGTVANANVASVVVNCDPNTFTIGGTVTGLASGASVTLTNDGVNLTRNVDGSFAFPTPVAAGTTYNVTVSTQPTAPVQVCTVANAIGTVSANVTNITVTCVTSTFTVGGTVTGLAGGSVTLQNNGGDNITVGADGSFTFPAIPSGGVYAVTVLTHPTGPTQVCNVASAGGNVTNANVTNVTVTCTTPSFTVGGTLTGLGAGKSIVLQNNGGDDLPLNADAPFVFATALASGANFSVSVLTQPAGQNCTVSGATGTVGGANVSSVVVNCADNSFTIGGTVSGLAGTLTLQNNGGNVTPVSSNGTFAFSVPLLTGATYEVTVSDPTAPAQTCTVANATGTVGAANVVNVAVTCTTNTYLVGGTVTGLAPNQSVVLRNNGTNDLQVTADGAGNGPFFSFTTPVASGASYLVSVITNPASPVTQTCTVTNASGSITTANVTNVLIVCTTNKYTVGGTITGLTGTLVLQNNGGDNKTLTDNTPFTFATPVNSGQLYAVTVLIAPTNPHQTCNITNPGGTVTNAPVTSVSIVCTVTPFKIRGTVTGLDNAPPNTVTLHNNGGDAITVGNGAFEFPAPVLSGNPYLVTVSAQPTNPVQDCTVSSEQGTVGGSDVTNVTVNCVANTFTVGGTINGLASGSTVVLQDNGGTPLSVVGGGGATPFNFPVVPNGHTYNVTVQTSPSTPVVQSCSITSGGVGTVAGANVTSVLITCTTTAFKVKVTVSGHSTVQNVGGGTSNLVLRNNGGDDLTVNSNNTFEFTTPISSGGGYSVAVADFGGGLLGNPTNPHQVCTVTNGSGTITNADVTALVSCSRTTFTVQGIVNGLASGKSIVLQNNGTDNTTVNGPAGTTATTPVVFSTQIANGSPYAVTILTQPTNGNADGSQLCTVRNSTANPSSGTIPTFEPATITTIVVDCGRTCNSRRNGGDTSTGSGSIDPDGQGGNPAFNAHCDMTFSSGGWTLIMMTNGTNGPAQTSEVQSLIPNGILVLEPLIPSSNNQRLFGAVVQTLARLSSQVHIRANVTAVAANGSTDYVTSTANSVPIQNLRNLQILNFGVTTSNNATQQSFWTQNSLAITIFNFSTAPSNTTWPSIYQATGNTAGFQFNGSNAGWSSNEASMANEGSKRVYVK